MAQHQASEGVHPAMDYAEHERTYEGFLRFATIGTIWCLTIVLGLAIGATGKSWWTGGLMVVLSTTAAAIGIFNKSIDHKAATGVFLLAFVVWVAKAM